MKLEEIGKKCCDCLGEKIELLDSYAAATFKLKDALASKDLNLVNRHTKERQRIIGKIEGIDGDLDGLMKIDGFSVDDLSWDVRSMARGYIGQIRERLESIAAMDCVCLEQAAKERDTMKSAILKLRQGRSAAVRYRPERQQVPRFLDMQIGSKVHGVELHEYLEARMHKEVYGYDNRGSFNARPPDGKFRACG